MSASPAYTRFTKFLTDLTELLKSRFPTIAEEALEMAAKDVALTDELFEGLEAGMSSIASDRTLESSKRIDVVAACLYVLNMAANQLRDAELIEEQREEIERLRKENKQLHELLQR